MERGSGINDAQFSESLVYVSTVQFTVLVVLLCVASWLWSNRFALLFRCRRFRARWLPGGHRLRRSVSKGPAHDSFEMDEFGNALEAGSELDGVVHQGHSATEFDWQRESQELLAASTPAKRLKGRVLVALIALTLVLYVVSGWVWPCAPPADPAMLHKAYQDLYRVTDILKAHSIRFFLVESSLLFAIRDKGVQMWDYNDFDLGMDDKDVEKLASMSDVFNEHGFFLKRGRRAGFGLFPKEYYYQCCEFNPSKWWYTYVVFLGRKPPHIDVHVLDGIDLTSYIPPEELVELDSVRFGDRDMPVPKNPHKALKAWFGDDYMTPMKPRVMVKCLWYKGHAWMVTFLIAMAVFRFMP